MKYTNALAGPHRLLFAAACLVGAPAFAAHQGDPDPAFGGVGYLTHDFFGTSEEIDAIAPMRDRRFVVVGRVEAANAQGPGGSLNVAVSRFLPNGTLDDTFGVGGLFNLDIDGGTDEANSVKLLSDGSLLIGASLTTHAYSDFGILKLRADGSLDTSFGEADAGAARKGFVRLDIGGASVHDRVAAMTTQRDGRIVAAGVTPVMHANGFAYAQVAVARFTADGVLDTSFGAGTGHVVLPPSLGDAADVLTGIALDQAGNLPADDRITLVGYTFARSDAFVMRLNPDGTPDATFGGGTGRIRVQPGSAGGQQTGVWMIQGARVQRDGRIVVIGEGNDRGLIAMRFQPSGALDGTFGSGGRTLVKFSGGADYDEPGAIALQGNGKIVLSGYATNRVTGAGRRDFYVARLNTDGSVDTGFGTDPAHPGQVVAQIVADDDAALAVGVEVSGNILAGGLAKTSGNGTDFALLRVIGDPDRIFANGFDVPAF